MKAAKTILTMNPTLKHFYRLPNEGDVLLRVDIARLVGVYDVGLRGECLGVLEGEELERPVCR